MLQSPPLFASALKLVLLQLGVSSFFLAETHCVSVLVCHSLSRRYQLPLLLFAAVLYMGVQMQHSPQGVIVARNSLR